MTQLVTGSVPLLVAAPNGILKTRELILSLAVRGRLVAQDPDEQSAQELVESIRAAHPSLCGIPAAAQVPISDSEKRFDVPASWTWVRFGFATDSRLGKMLDKAKNTGEHRPYLRNTNVQWARFDLDDIKTMQLEEYELDDYRVLPGDLLICEGGEPGRCAVWRDSEQTIFFQKALHRARPRNAISADFIQICLRVDCSSGVLGRLFTGATIKHLPGEKLVKYPFPLPPLAEQHRIVAKVDELMALCDRLEADQADAEAAHAKLVEALLASLTQACDAADFRASWQQLAEHFHTLFNTEASVDALEQTVLQLALRGHLCESSSADGSARQLLREIENEKLDLYQRGQASKPKQFLPLPEDRHPYALPQGWTWARLGELGVTSTGSTPPTSDTAAFGGMVPFIGPGQIRPDGVITQGEKSLTAHGAKNSSIAKPGDLLMVCIGGSIGKCAVADRELAFNQQINCISVLGARPRYVNIILASPDFQKAILAAATGSATPIINRSKWEEIAVPVPPLAVQDRIVESVGNFMTQSRHLKRELASAREHLGHLAQVLVEHASAVEA